MADRIGSVGVGQIGLQPTAADLEHITKGTVQEAQSFAIAPLATQHQLKAAGYGVRLVDASRLAPFGSSPMSTVMTRHYVGRVLRKLPQTEDQFGKLGAMEALLRTYHSLTNQVVQILGKA